MQWQDITGNKYNRLTVVDNFNGIRTKWNCICECGGKVVATSGQLRSGNTKSCGCLLRDVLKKRNTTHGMSYVPEYRIWKGILKRCFNKNDKRYKDYAERGISIHTDFAKDFPAWFTEVGKRPTDGQHWSIGRIDNNGWYTYGNMRWELDSEQAQNHTKQRNNTSGTTGIQIQKKVIAGTLYTAIVACWTEEGKKRTKNFSADKYGYDKAMELALEYRINKINYLNENGASYAESHGSEK